MSKTILIPETPRIASELIEIPISSGAQGRITLPDVPQLRNQGDQIVVIKAIRLITAKVLTTGPTTGVATTPVADLRKLVLTLYCNGWEKGHYIPVLLLNDVADGDSTAGTTIQYRNHTTRLSDWVNVDWNKSYVLFANSTSASTASTLILEVEYLKMQKNNVGDYVEVNG